MFIIFMWLGVYGHKMNHTGLAKLESRDRRENSRVGLHPSACSHREACRCDFPERRARSLGEEEREYVFDW